MRKLTGIALVVLFASACFVNEGDEIESVGFHGAEVVNGTEDSGDPAVVALVSNGQLACSGTLIGPRTVLTAAHCVAPYTPFSITGVFFGSRLDSPGTTIATVGTTGHPLWDVNQYGYDIGLVFLQVDATTTPKKMLARPPTTADVGKQLRVVGFGSITPDGQQDSIKRTGTVLISEVTGDGIFSSNEPSTLCPGDSGGPAFLLEGGVEVIAGINSRGDCLTVSINERIDLYASFLDQNATCAYDGICKSGCGTDPDCPVLDPPEPDEDEDNGQDDNATSGEFGSYCEGSEECASGVCTGISMCSQTCTVGSLSCPSTFECRAVDDGSQGVCFPSDLTGGCSTSGRRTSGGWLWLALALAITRRRRRLA